MKISAQTSKRFWSKVKKTLSKKGCWLWIASKSSNGYGAFWYKDKVKLAHRISYAIHKGKIPRNKTIDHLCRIRHCINPDHMEVVTGKINTLRGESIPAINARKTHCQNGHEFTIENTNNYKGLRICRTCHKEYNRQWRIDHPDYWK